MPTNMKTRKLTTIIMSRKLKLLTLFTLIFYYQLLSFCLEAVQSIAPTIDYSHNMRILKIPKSVKVGELIYRLKGSDGDPNSQLKFGVSGIEARALLDIVQVPNSWNEADVFLRSRLLPSSGNDEAPNFASSLAATFAHQQQQQQQHQLEMPIYNLTIYVSDGNKSTQVESTIIVTNDDELESNHFLNSAALNRTYKSYTSTSNDNFNLQTDRLLANVNITSINNNQLPQPQLQPHQQTTSATSHSALWSPLSPFIKPRHVFSVPENTAPGESIGSLSVRESDKSDLPVRFELRGKGADYFAIKYVFGPRGQSRAELVLAQPVDYEKQNLFNLKVLALNAWTNIHYDTRNVATLDIVITVGDVQDTAPKWLELPHFLRIANDMQPGQLLGRVQAQDGDLGDQRPIQYALDASSPLVNFFAIDVKTGELRLSKAANELALAEHSLGTSGTQLLIVYASELPDTSSYDHLWPPMFARAELPLLLVDQLNEPPKFVGGLQTQTVNLQPPTQSQPQVQFILHGFLREFANQQTTNSLLNRQVEHDDSLSNDRLASRNGLGGHLVQWYLNHSSEISNDLLINSASRSTRNRPMVLDLGQGSNGTFELTLEGPDAHLFELEPDYPVSRQSMFNLLIAPNANRSEFDSDSDRQNMASGSSVELQHQSGKSGRIFQVDVVARDFGSPQRLSSRIRCQIELIDVDDNAPQFETDLYSFQVYENAPVGHVLGTIRARDADSRGSNSGSYSRSVRYSSLTGLGSHLFKLDPDSGLISLAAPHLDRERRDHYLMIAEAKDGNGGSAANYTKIMVSVLDVNDNAPVFSQTHYDAVLLADGSFYQPLVVSATDADEPQSANSQVAYEIIAGNSNDQFTIDALSGAIYPTGLQLATPRPTQVTRSPSGLTSVVHLPPILSEPIVPFGAQPDPNGKIKPPVHEIEIEETTIPSNERRISPKHHSGDSESNLRLNWPRQIDERRAGHFRGRPALGTPSLPESPMNLLEQLPALDLLLSANEPDDGSGSSRHVVRSAPQSPQSVPQTQSSTETSSPVSGSDATALITSHRDSTNQIGFDASKVPPLTTLVIRAHDFGIPLRSATCKVNIYNQAQLSRSISVILNGTAEQLEQRREMIERAFGALTASKAQIESIDALSDSSSISVARLKLAIPAGHSLIDLTDLRSLMNALDYKPIVPANQQQQQQSGNFQHQQFKQPLGTHYIATSDGIYPIRTTPLSNITSSNGGPQNGYLTPTFYTDINQISLDSNALERKLLFYIIIVGICILALLVVWMIYFCCRETEQSQQVKRAAKSSELHTEHRKHQRQSSGDLSVDLNTKSKKRASQQQKTLSKTQLIDDEDQDCSQGATLNAATQAKSMAMNQSAIGNNLAKKQQQQISGPQNALLGPNFMSLKPGDQFSMYNGQVWFEQGGLRSKLSRAPQAAGAFERRASSAPSAGANSLDSSLRAALHADGRSSAFLSSANSTIMMQPMPQLNGFVNQSQKRSAQGQFFPNTIGYMENLASIKDGAQASGGGTRRNQFGSGLFGKGSSSSRHRGHRSGKVVPMTLLNDQTQQHHQQQRQHQMRGHANRAFENDLESGGTEDSRLILVPASSLINSNEFQRSSQESDRYRRQHHRRQEDGQSLSSDRSPSCSSSSSGATRTRGAESHESVLLDSDQELLGFDSTGTPIIATHTRRSEPAASPIQESSRIQTTSNKTITDTSNGFTAERDNRTGPRDDAVIITRTRASIIGPTQDREGDNGDKTDNQTKQSEQKESEVQPVRQESGNNKVGIKTTEGAVIKEPPRPELDLMSELNQRLANGNQKQRASLKRQSADETDSQVVVNSKLAETNKMNGPEQKAEDETDANRGTVAVASKVNGGESNLLEQEHKVPNEGSNTTATSIKQQRRISSGSLSCQSTISSTETTIATEEGSQFIGARNNTNKGNSNNNRLRDMKNGELLEKQSIFAMTYSGLATDKPPS